MNKKELRKNYKELRKSLTEAEVESLSELIRIRFLDFLKNQFSVKHIHIFIPIKQFYEINTIPLLHELFRQDKKVYTSSLNMEKDFMETLELFPGTVFKIDSWGIPVPVDSKMVDPRSIQLVLVPLLAFDRKGHRLGYGKGHYDKFLEKLDQKVIKVGLSFFPPTALLPTENHDIALDYCITPEEIFVFE